MSWTIVYLLLSILCLIHRRESVVSARGQGQMTHIKVLESDDDLQCALMDERERARNQIHQISTSILAMAHQDGGALLLST